MGVKAKSTRVVLVAIALTVAAAFAVVAIPQATADTISIKPSKVVVDKGHRGRFCNVLRGYERPREVNLYCFGEGKAWVKMRVRDIVGHASGVKVYSRSKCRSVQYRWKQEGSSIIIKVVGKGVFDCFVNGIEIRGVGVPSPSPSPSPSPTPSATVTTSTTTTVAPSCDPSYPTVCIPPPPPDLNCDNVPYTDFVVLPPDPHGFDGDFDGIGCETI